MRNNTGCPFKGGGWGDKKTIFSTVVERFCKRLDRIAKCKLQVGKASDYREPYSSPFDCMAMVKGGQVFIHSGLKENIPTQKQARRKQGAAQ